MSSKNSRVKIHVGRNQKFTSKNSRAKNSHGPIWVGLCGPVLRWRGPWRAQMAGTDGAGHGAKVRRKNDTGNGRGPCLC